MEFKHVFVLLFGYISSSACTSGRCGKSILVGQYPGNTERSNSACGGWYNLPDIKCFTQLMRTTWISNIEFVFIVPDKWLRSILRYNTKPTEQNWWELKQTLTTKCICASVNPAYRNMISCCNTVTLLNPPTSKQFFVDKCACLSVLINIQNSHRQICFQIQVACRFDTNKARARNSLRQM